VLLNYVRAALEMVLQLFRKGSEKMNKKLLTIAIALVILAMVVAPVAALKPEPTVTAAVQNPNAGTSSIWVAINDLYAKVAALTLKVNSIPAGAQGPKGDTGATGATGATGPAGATGATVHLGKYVFYQDNTEYTATTDGFVYVIGGAGGSVSSDEVHATFQYSDGQGAWSDFGEMKLSTNERDIMTIPVSTGTIWQVKTLGYTLRSPFDVFWIPLTP
jgi:hypothetical protein